MTRAPDEHDPLLATLVRSVRLGKNGESAIRDVILGSVGPQVTRLLTDAARRGGVRSSDTEDLANEVVLRVIVQLRRLAEDPVSEPIARLGDYVDTVFRHALDDHQRRLDPPRAKLAHRVRYVLSHTRTLAVWGRDPMLCGLVEWIGRGSSGTVPQLLGSAGHFRPGAPALRAMVEKLVRAAGAPVEVSDLIDALASASGLSAEPFVADTALRSLSLSADPGEGLVSRQYLSQLWGEIERLPVPQRWALLLNLRTDDGDSIARALALLGIAGVRRLAAGLQMPVSELLALWNELPLPDLRIAAMLGLTRQQIINLRKSARERLARRMGRPRAERRSGE